MNLERYRGGLEEGKTWENELFSPFTEVQQYKKGAGARRCPPKVRLLERTREITL